MGFFVYHHLMDRTLDQISVLRKLLSRGKNTAYGRYIGLDERMDYDTFASQIPVVKYTDLEPWIDRCKSGESDVLWPGGIHRYAVSSGTTGAGKHIPISDDRLSSDLQFMRRVMRLCIREYPDPGLFLGSHVALSGSIEQQDHNIYGEISGMLALESPRWIQLWHSLNPRLSSNMLWAERFEKLIQANLYNDVRVLSGVPSWLLILLREVSRRRNKPIDTIWPNLKLIVSGGVALSGFYDVIQHELGALRPRYLENYGASEGYFSTGFYETGSMNLVTDLNIFYEFFELYDNHSSNYFYPQSTCLVPLWEVKPHVPYGMVITNNSGLWRYMMNDVILFDSITPPRISVVSRLSEMTDTFGEALTSFEVNSVLNKLLPDQPYHRVHIQSCWTIDPKTPYHHWIFVVDNGVKRDHHMALTNDELSKKIDDELRSINRHYANRRETKAMVEPIVSFLTFTEYEILLRKLNKAQSKLGLFI